VIAAASLLADRPLLDDVVAEFAMVAFASRQEVIVDDGIGTFVVVVAEMGQPLEWAEVEAPPSMHIDEAIGKDHPTFPAYFDTGDCFGWTKTMIVANVVVAVMMNILSFVLLHHKIVVVDDL
jgi:hypothetical protein